jgi:hypothetical protein
VRYRRNLAIFISYFIPDSLIDKKNLSKQERISIMNEFQESNRKVAKEYLGRKDGRLFYSKP